MKKNKQHSHHLPLQEIEQSYKETGHADLHLCLSTFEGRMAARAAAWAMIAAGDEAQGNKLLQIVKRSEQWG